MHRDNPLWGEWGEKLAWIYQREINPASIHPTEQVAFNYLIYAHEKLVALEAVHNYNCHIGCAKRLNDDVVVGTPPFRKIGVVHLPYTSKLIAAYLSNGLLFDNGDYLEEEEREALKRIAHY